MKPRRSLVLAVLITALFALALVVAACAGEETTTATWAVTTTTQAVTATQAVTTTQAPVAMSKAEIGHWKTDAIAFAVRWFGAYGDANAGYPELADDATFYDPTDGDFLIEGKDSIVSMMRGLFSYFPDMKAHRQGAYLSAGAAAYAVTMDDFWPPWVPEPANRPPLGLIEVFRFKDGLVASWDIWFSAAALEMVRYGVFAPDKGGPEQLQKRVDRYLAAWSSGDKARIAALYQKDASFSDTMRGDQAQGPAAIADLSDKRFGSAGTITFKPIDLYALTNGPRLHPQIPDNGAIVGVGIHYRCTLLVEGTPKTVEGLTTFELGTRRGEWFALDPNGLITREEVFYDPDSLLASGLVG